MVMLNDQKNIATTNPDTTINFFSASTPEMNGVKTKVASTTCPMSAKIEDNALRWEEVKIIFIWRVHLITKRRGNATVSFLKRFAAAFGGRLGIEI
jgi:hypothetical protein